MDDNDDLFSSVGEVSEDDLNIKPKDFQEMVVEPTDWTIGVLIDLLKRKKIDLQPNYQRRIAWTTDKMSKFIESLFLRLPVPQIVLAETQPGRFAVIDGKQRLNSLARFCLDTKDPLRLKGCKYRADLENLTYDEMQQAPALEGALDAFPAIRLGHGSPAPHWLLSISNGTDRTNRCWTQSNLSPRPPAAWKRRRIGRVQIPIPRPLPMP
ncbi:DUF262 domain-containing protein [Mesorhizobium sp. INR15]|uniref:DUF262 domain-containing protein n=1 Tax=Mesorhizobium sp. INR15 TaxID=2654248 RepID=UPI001896760F|nr:DUF262 domain-containing protein [Mesorhizobium sp. INR15]QPC94729.1 DUF262 domain-containing protein [Mesorhizobium sp. INR15]